MAIIRKKIKIEDLFNKLEMYNEEQTWVAPKSLKVKSVNGFEKVDALYKTDKREITSIIVEDEKTKEVYSLSGVLEHRVMTNNGWKYLKNISNMDKVKTINGFGNVRVFKLEGKENCYDLQVENTHSFYTNNILSHNTEIFIALCKLTGIKALILFARVDLAHQTLRRMKNAELDAGIIQGSNIDENHNVVMATVQSCHKLKNKYDMVVVDECHRASAEQYQNVIMMSMFSYRIGFSATPFIGKKDLYRDANIKSWLGDIIYVVEPSPLIKSGRIAKPTIHMVPIDRPINLREKRWQAAEKWGIIENTYRNKVIHYLCQSLHGKILILVKRIDHGNSLQKLIPGSVFLSGDNKVKERQEVTARFDEGDDFVLIASTIFDEGIDIKNVNNVVVVGGGSSYYKTLQRMGRGMRTTDTKSKVNIYDFYDTTNDILTKQANERIKIYTKEGYKDIKYISEEKVKKMFKIH